MRSILHEQRSSSIVTAVLTIVVGALLVFQPHLSVALLCTILGLAALAKGVVYIVGWMRRRRSGRSVLFILPGVVLCVLGLWLIDQPGAVLRMIQYIFGIILLVHGLVSLQGAFSLMRQSCTSWWIDMILALVTGFLGILIILNPFGTFSALAMITGLSLIFDGVSSLLLIRRLDQVIR